MSIAARSPAARNLLDYALYVAFFPQLVAGPIERATHLLPQFQSASGRLAHAGVRVRAAARSSGACSRRSSSRTISLRTSMRSTQTRRPFSGTALLTATVFFAFQIYCDFSGYSDTARGVARMLGFELMRNFDFPYFSRNPGRVLAPLAHQPVGVVPGLSLLPARDALHAPRRLGEQIQGTHHLDGVSSAFGTARTGRSWSSACTGVSDRGVSRILDRTADAEPTVFPAPRRVGGTRASSGARVPHVHPRLHRLGAFQSRFVRRRVACAYACFLARQRFGVIGAEVVAAPILWALIFGLMGAEWIYRHARSSTPETRGWAVAGHRGSLCLDRGDLVSVGASQVGAPAVHLLPVLIEYPRASG